MKKIGIYNPYINTKGGGERVALTIASILSRKPGYKVTLITHGKVDFELLGDYFGLDLKKVEHQEIRFRSKIYPAVQRSPLPQRVKNMVFDLKVLREVKKARYDIFVNNCWQSNLPNPSKFGIYMCMFPQKIHPGSDMSLLKKIYLVFMDITYRVLTGITKPSVYSYDLITANSAYTQSYIKKYWGLPSQILYPVCENMQNGVTEKKKIIMHVGRFFENYGENHHKRQDFLLDTFAKMTRLHEEGWQLHFAGTVAEDVGALRYILSLSRKAEHLPVVFHFNCSFSELKKLYNESTIYWHATGYGSDPDLHPEKQEHFGITTVEAMSAGCIPIVYNTAGQKESVDNKVNGYLWDTPGQLIKTTEQVVHASETELNKLRQAAKSRSKDFDLNAFTKSVEAIFGEIPA